MTESQIKDLVSACIDKAKIENSETMNEKLSNISTQNTTEIIGEIMKMCLDAMYYTVEHTISDVLCEYNLNNQ